MHADCTLYQGRDGSMPVGMEREVFGWQTCCVWGRVGLSSDWTLGARGRADEALEIFEGWRFGSYGTFMLAV